MKPTIEQTAACHALLAYLYNTSAVRFAAEVYGDQHPEYIQEKVDLYIESPVRAVGRLDDEHFARLVEKAWQSFGHAALGRLSVRKEASL